MDLHECVCLFAKLNARDRKGRTFSPDCLFLPCCVFLFRFVDLLQNMNAMRCERHGFEKWKIADLVDGGSAFTVVEKVLDRVDPTLRRISY